MKRFEVHGFIRGRGFLARFYDADTQTAAVQQFHQEFPQGQAFWVAPAPGAQVSGSDGSDLGPLFGIQMGLHTVAEQRKASRMADRAYNEALRLLKDGRRLRRATEDLGFLQALSALARAEGVWDLRREVERQLEDLGPRLDAAWKGA